MSCCGRDAKWKREKIQDHKFDYIDVDDFKSTSCMTYSKYGMVYAMTLKSILSYMAEVLVVILLILVLTKIKVDGLPDPSVNNLDQSGKGTSADANKTTSLNDVLGGDLNILSPNVRIGLIIASVFVSFILLVFEWKKAFTIIQSRDISYAFTSTIAYRYYAIRSFAHFCVFDKISKSKKMKDTLSLWVYFRLKGNILYNNFIGWKKLIFAESPRQILNAINVFAFTTSFKGNIFVKYFQAFEYSRTKLDSSVFALFVLSSLLVLIWIFAMTLLVLSFFVYLFLLQSIRGNLKEYCVHKIDKRIDSLLKKKSRKRVLEARKAELDELERNRNNLEARAAPPLGMSVGPRYPNVSLNYDNEAYGSEYGDMYSRSDYGGAGNGYNGRVLMPVTVGGSDYAGSEVGGPVGNVNYSGSNYGGGTSEYSYGGLNPVYNPSTTGSRGYNQRNVYYDDGASDYGSDAYTWQRSNYSESNYPEPARYKEHLPPVPEQSMSQSSSKTEFKD